MWEIVRPLILRRTLSSRPLIEAGKASEDSWFTGWIRFGGRVGYVKEKRSRYGSQFTVLTIYATMPPTPAFVFLLTGPVLDRDLERHTYSY
jgi:hypothetical protein